jgi:hypothetical protein
MTDAACSVTSALLAAIVNAFSHGLGQQLTVAAVDKPIRYQTLGQLVLGPGLLASALTTHSQSSSLNHFRLTVGI